MKLIEELYFGNIDPNGKILRHNKGYHEALQTIAEHEELLMHMLEGKEKKYLIAILNAYSVVGGESSVANFTIGFKLGAKLASEMLDDDIEVCLKNMM